MIENKLVSVIIPTYKGSSSIVSSVKSVLEQSYENLEVIVVDDNGSGTDEQIKTEKILNDNIHDSRFLYLKHEKNINGSAARNTGIKASKGDYIAFLDDDDIWFKNKLEKQINVFETLDDSYGLVYCGGYNVNMKGCGAPKISRFLQGDILYDFLAGKIDFNSSMFVIRRSVLDVVPGFDESYRRLQDWEFCTRILYKFKGYGFKEYLIAKFRAQRNNVSNPEKLLEYYQHYMDKISGILDSFGEKKSQKVRARFYRRIALEYLKNKDIKNAVKYLKKDESLIRGVVLLSKYIIIHGFYRIVYKNKKCLV